MPAIGDCISWFVDHFLHVYTVIGAVWGVVAVFTWIVCRPRKKRKNRRLRLRAAKKGWFYKFRWSR